MKNKKEKDMPHAYWCGAFSLPGIKRDQGLHKTGAAWSKLPLENKHPKKTKAIKKFG